MPLLQNALSSLLGFSGDSWNWQDHIHPASFRGVPFAIIDADGNFGRRQAVHEYPYRDTVWVEDLGRSTRRLTLNGFIIQSSPVYNAADVMTQRDNLIAACESAGAGTLVHPTLGELTVSIPDGGLKLRESKDSERVFEFSLTVIESGLRVFAVTGAVSAASTVQTSWLALAAKTAATFIAEVNSDLRTVTQAIKTLKSTVSFWTSMVTCTANEATNLSNTLKSTFGSTRYGRYNTGDVGGNTSGATNTTTTTADTNNYDLLVSQKMAASVENRAEVQDVTASLLASVSVAAYASGAQDVINALLSSEAKGLDLVRLFETLAAFTDTTYRPDSSDSSIASAAQIYLITLSAGAMAYAASLYEPVSYDDAAELLQRVVSVIDTVSLAAADAGYDDVFSEMSDLKTKVKTTFQEKGAQLANVSTVTFSAALPALNLANRLYQDASRTEGLVKMADPVHPAFMPLSFRALSS
ncbi:MULTISPECIES: DNA circularization protein [Rahnella]|uniref:DNA circularization protein n=1 Tax=Rahnella laticis TaxID=2787622 RepID=A0ABS0E0P4_9GAMM|nr:MULTISPECIES: DNA circularization N-terminal domain-containing protein [Rahnella]MBF7978647.1 DNA circularization protein [Rahnella laticis]MBF7998737.1 DNA circularization protein [Rahnella sp. LAC-M12]